MINKNLCHDGQSPNKKKRHETEEDSLSRLDKGKRPKIISPRRQKYETQFEKFMVVKHVDEKIKDKPEPPKEDGKFDTITKLTGSLNAKVREKQQQLIELEK